MTTHPDQEQETQLLAEAFRHLSSGLVITNPRQADHPIVYVNAGYCQLTGYEADEVIGRNCRFLQGAETDPEVVGAMREAIKNQETFRGLVQNYRKDGSRFHNALVITPIFDESGEISHHLGTLNDVSTSREQLRALAAHATRAREAERTSIAREIHDELGQALTSLKIDLSWLDKHLDHWCPQPEIQGDGADERADKSAELHQRARAMISLTEATIHTVQRIAIELRPSLLDDIGLEAAAQWQVKDFAARNGIVCDFKSSLGDEEVSPAIATAGFRILQEALTNVARHAQATRVRVRLDRRSQELRLEVRDNGQGIQPSGLTTFRSLGLLGMRERALGLGGSVEVGPAKLKAGGTCVTAHLPLNHEADETDAP